MNKIKDLLNKKIDLNDFIINKHDAALTALEKIGSNKVGALFVTDQENLIGLFSEAEYYKNVIHKGTLSLVISVADVMTQKIPFVTTDCLLEDCLKSMKEKNLTFMPIFEKEKAVGIISKEMVIDFIIEKKEFMITQLTNYITGTSLLIEPTSTADKCYQTCGDLDLFNVRSINLLSNTA